MLEKTRLLIYLAQKGALYSQIELSTIIIAKEINSSQQTVSRKLIELEHDEFVERVPSTRGIKIIIKEKGSQQLKEIHSILQNVFGEKITSFKGTLESGLGEGSYYVALKQYQDQFKNVFGFVPFNGTLNLRVDYREFLQFISGQQKIVIEGFKTQNRTFGSIVSYLVMVNDVKSAIIIPERTSHNRDTIEVISDVNFREKFNLKDGDSVTITPHSHQA